MPEADFPTTVGELESLCFNMVAEGLQIEFKQKEDCSSSTVSKIDKRAIAEAVSSFANSDGGRLIYGIKTQRQGGVDVAVELVPISDIDEFEVNFRTVCALNISPPIPDVVVRSIKLDESSRGFLVCDTPRSDSRPHMSTAPGIHSYFRRSFEGSVPMTPSEIRDQVLAVRDAILEPITTYPAGASFSPSDFWVSFKIGVRFSLKNVGRSVCRNPFLRVRADCQLHSPSATYDDSLKTWKTTLPWGSFIHVGDREDCLTLSFNGCVRFDVLSGLFAGPSPDLTNAVFVLPGSANYHVDNSALASMTSLDEIVFEMTFGAENAPVLERSFTLTRRNIAKGLFTFGQIGAYYMQSVGPYRRSAVDEFVEST